MIYYPALIERSADGHGLLFPDVPGCVTTGRDAAELMAHAIEALTLHLESRREDGDPVPAPGELDDPQPAWLADLGEGRFARTLVPAEIGGTACLAERLAMALPPDQRRKLAELLAAG